MRNTALRRALAVVDRLGAGGAEVAVDSTSNAVDCTSSVEVAGGAEMTVDSTSSADRPNGVGIAVESTSGVGIAADSMSTVEVVVDSTSTVEVVAVVVVMEDNNDFQCTNTAVGGQECNCWSDGCR
jgi:hypothetical protein